MSDDRTKGHSIWQSHLRKGRRIQIVAYCQALGGMLSAPHTHLLGLAIMAVGVFLFLMVYLQTKKTMRCPACDKDLSYLAFDPNYSKTIGVIALPPDIRISPLACPYCGQGLAEDGSVPVGCSGQALRGTTREYAIRKHLLLTAFVALITVLLGLANVLTPRGRHFLLDLQIMGGFILLPAFVLNALTKPRICLCESGIVVSIVFRDHSLRWQEIRSMRDLGVVIVFATPRRNPTAFFLPGRVFVKNGDDMKNRIVARLREIGVTTSR